MTPPFVPPKLNVQAFNCPHCSAYAKQDWVDPYYHGNGACSITGWRVAICTHCNGFSFWTTGDGSMHYPDRATVPLPSPDLPPDVKQDYDEARTIAARSPRGAAALLRLSIQRLCIHLGEKGKNLNDDIGSLVTKGLPSAVQKSLDVVRVIGNESVHPGAIDLRDDETTVNVLFRLVNLIAEKMITEPREIEEIYEMIPGEKRAQIEKRDKT
jgi:Domain of unknown function (DUF4145)